MTLLLFLRLLPLYVTIAWRTDSNSPAVYP